MPLSMPFLQDLLHRFELGGGMRYFRVGLAVLAVLLLTAGYNFRAFKNMGTQEAMDAAQLARNIARGKGYTTLFVRPFSMFLVQKHSQETQGVQRIGKFADLAKIRKMHPDLANPPVYPVVLAGLMKVLPFRYGISTTAAFWSHGGGFWRFEPDFVISLFNQLLFLGLITLVFFLARHLFDAGVAWLSAALLLGLELFWRFSVSGLSTMLLMVIFLGLTWFLVLLEQEARTPKWGPPAILVLSCLAGLMVGLGGLTRYAFGWLILPVLAFVIVFGGPRRAMLALILLATFAAVMTPWILRNYNASGTPFGTATYTIMENTVLFPEFHLQRSLEPNLGRAFPMAFWLKLNLNLRQIITSELPRLGGNWVTAFFLVGLLIGFRNPAISRLRYFLIGCLVVLSFTQALGRTQLSEQSPSSIPRTCSCCWRHWCWFTG